MAIWQFRVILIPEASLAKVFGSVPPAVPIELAEDFPWWSHVQPPKGIEQQINSILPPAESWSKEMRMWGLKHSDTAYVIYVDETKTIVEEVSFSVDARAISAELVDAICAFARQLGCVLMTSEYEIVMPEHAAALSAIEHSSARKFVDDPVSTLQHLKHTKLQDALDYMDKQERDPRREQ